MKLSIQRIPIKLLLLLLLIIFAETSFAQTIPPRFAHHQHVLIADNGKYHRSYVNLRPLKVHFLDAEGKDKKAKGRLLILHDSEIQFVPFGKKPIVMIGVDSILSITSWNRKGRIGIPIVGGMGGVLTGAGFYLGNLPGFFLFIMSGSTLFLTAMMVPIMYLTEWLSTSSVSKGYYFSIAP